MELFRQVYYFNNSTERSENVDVYFSRGVCTLDRFQSDPVESVMYIFIRVLLSRTPLGARRLPLHCVMFYDVTSISVASFSCVTSISALYCPDNVEGFSKASVLRTSHFTRENFFFCFTKL